MILLFETMIKFKYDDALDEWMTVRPRSAPPAIAHIERARAAIGIRN